MSKELRGRGENKLLLINGWKKTCQEICKHIVASDKVVGSRWNVQSHELLLGASLN